MNKGKFLKYCLSELSKFTYVVIMKNMVKFLRKYLFIWMFIGILLFLFSLSFYFYTFSGGFSNKPDEWGNFGSYVGGIIGTILSGMNLLILIILTYKTKEEQNHEWITSIRIKKYHELIQSLKQNCNPQDIFNDKDLDADFFLFDKNYDTLMKIQKSLQVQYTVELKDDLLKFLKSIIKSQDEITKEIIEKYK